MIRDHDRAGISDFDHSFPCTVDGQSPGCLSTNSNHSSNSLSNVQTSFVFKRDVIEILEDGITASSFVRLHASITKITEICWDHCESQFRLRFQDETNQSLVLFVIIGVVNSLELEQEFKLRIKEDCKLRPGTRPPSFSYIGMLAGPTKPMPFQRKRPSLSQRINDEKLPPLDQMKRWAISMKNCESNSRSYGIDRRYLAMQHIHDGFNTFQLQSVRSIAINRPLTQQEDLSVLFRRESLLLLDLSGCSFVTYLAAHPKMFAFADIADWTIHDYNSPLVIGNESIVCLEIIVSDCRHLFQIAVISAVRHTFEYYWNQYRSSVSASPKCQSSHGRSVVATFTLLGNRLPVDCPGSLDYIDADGSTLTPGERRRLAGTRTSLFGSVLSASLPLEIAQVKTYWCSIVMHQGWLNKKGGPTKTWTKRYFVLYKTSQGHYLAYYSDISECPLFFRGETERNDIDLAKVTFIRPVSNMIDAPPNSFDILTIEREWTLSADNQLTEKKWIQIITRAVDEDVAIVPDGELSFTVKATSDNTGLLTKNENTTTLKISSWGVSILTRDSSSVNKHREVLFWSYTDFYKWSVLTQHGKMSILINVFSDDSFKKRSEFVFQSKDVQQIATIIEYYIEKFMSLMHLTLENDEQAVGDRTGQIDVGLVANNSPVGAGSDNDNDDGITSKSSEPISFDLLSSSSSQPNMTESKTCFDGPAENDPLSSMPSPSNPFDILGSISSSSPSTDEFFHSEDPFTTFNNNNSSPYQYSEAQRNHLKALMFRVLAVRRGVVFDIGLVSVSLSIELIQSNVKMTVWMRSTTQNQLSNVSLVLDSCSPYLKIDTGHGCSWARLNSDEEVCDVVTLECQMPFETIQNASLKYISSSGSHWYVIPFPICQATFHDPISFSNQDFMHRWNKLGEQMEGCLSATVTPALLDDAYAMLQSTILQACQFSVSSGELLAFDRYAPLCGSALLKTGAVNQSGEKISVGCLIMIQVNDPAIFVGVRTTHPATSTSLLNMILLMMK